jgi:glycosyltransferase involved in cell wall biosynthesis
MRHLMVSGDRQVAIGERGPFHAMQREFSRWFERIDVLCPRPDRPQTVHTIHERVHFHPADCGRAGMVGSIKRRGAELLREHGHALVVSHDYGWFYNGIGSAALSRASGVPYLSEIHHVPGHPVAADLRERFDKRVARAYVRWARSRAAAFRVVNHGEMPALLRAWGVPDEQILVLPSLYIDLDVFHPAPGGAGAGEALQDEPAGRGSPFDQDVVFVGRAVANKGLLRLVDALARLAEQGEPQRALFVGKGPLRPRVEARVRARGLAEHVRFVDWVDSPEELARIYRQSRVCVCASTCEGGPRFTVEAMACGTPVVSTPVGVMGELLADGRAGRLAAFDSASHAKELALVLGDEPARRAMARAAGEIAGRLRYADVLRGNAGGLHRQAGCEVPTP